MKYALSLVVGLMFWGLNFIAYSQQTISNDRFSLEYNRYGINSITSPADPHGANPLRGNLGSIDLNYKIGPEGDWLSIYTGERKLASGDHSISYTDYIEGMPMQMKQTFSLGEKALRWTIELENRMRFPIRIGDLGIELPWRSPGGGGPQYIFEETFTKHHFISGDGSFIFFTRPSGEGPFFLVTVEPGTSLEYFTSGQGGYTAYIHSGYSGNAESGGTWRQPHTYGRLEPAGEEGDYKQFGFKLQWAESYDELRNLLYENGLIDIRVVPGMTVPEDLEARFSLHTKASIDSITAEYPGQTSLEYLGEKQPAHHIYKVTFDRLGENKLTVHFDGVRETYLEFFSTEPVATLVKKRSNFIVNKQQHRKPDRWYDGLYSIYDMKNSVLRGPDNTDGYEHWWGYVLASDDPILGKAPFVASKNVIYPDDEEIASLEYHIKNYVWGGLQRTDEEQPYPYGIYGTPNWKVNRDPLLRAGVKNRNLDKMNVWRSYDYPHMIMLYYHMYQIASFYPDKVNYLDAEGYLERTWQTAKAYFTYPYEILPWYETYKWGMYNEMLIPEIITLMEEKGRQEEADWLRREWEKKVKYFVYDDEYPFRSEYSIDRTAFESSYALARYGATHEMKPDTNLWWDKNEEHWYSHPEVSKKDSRAFMDRQHKAALSVRGWLETKYFLLGSDFTSSSDSHTLSYMARMGGWSILDYGLQFSEEPYDWLQLGYASYLSSFALMNTGTPESNYGYWYPGKENDGAAGWAFMASKFGRAWIRKDEPRGAWHYDGEIDLGMGAVTRTAATILSNDPIFGWTALGGKLEARDDSYRVWPRDGVRIRFWMVDGDRRTGLTLERDGWSDKKPIVASRDGRHIRMTLVNRTGDAHTTRLTLHRYDKAQFELLLDGKHIKPVNTSSREAFYKLPVTGADHRLEIVRK